MKEGFKPVQGDTLDEYRRPTENASGQHVHIEFNLDRFGASFCDDAV
ncbi:MAG: hypothetical protein KW793_01435 [Candidatus Doudnabacteria bacterium]|nr:hypothetical protein [Candidatus Doudnabacteria bacterium]